MKVSGRVWRASHLLLVSLAQHLWRHVIERAAELRAKRRRAASATGERRMYERAHALVHGCGCEHVFGCVRA
eukprot:1549748-Pleurochrysis_carterae.AAC.1